MGEREKATSIFFFVIYSLLFSLPLPLFLSSSLSLPLLLLLFNQKFAQKIFSLILSSPFTHIVSECTLQQQSSHDNNTAHVYINSNNSPVVVLLSSHHLHTQTHTRIGSERERGEREKREKRRPIDLLIV